MRSDEAFCNRQLRILYRAARCSDDRVVAAQNKLERQQRTRTHATNSHNHALTTQGEWGGHTAQQQQRTTIQHSTAAQRAGSAGKQGGMGGERTGGWMDGWATGQHGTVRYGECGLCVLVRVGCYIACVSIEFRLWSRLAGQHHNRLIARTTRTHTHSATSTEHPKTERDDVSLPATQPLSARSRCHAFME